MFYALCPFWTEGVYHSEKEGIAMIQTPMDVLHNHEVRKSGKQKQTFRDAVCAYAGSLGYQTVVEKGSLGSRNVVIGNASKAKYLITAHYDTPSRMFLPNLITPCNFWTYLAYQLAVVLLLMLPPAVFGILVGVLSGDSYTGFLAWYFLYLGMLLLMMSGPANPHTANDNTSGVVTLLKIAETLPKEARQQVAFVLFDLEEKGMVGSSSYRTAHKEETEKQIILNLDCVGDGDEIIAFPTKKVKKSANLMAQLRGLNTTDGQKTMTVHEKGFYVYPSDQSKFPLGVGIAAFKRWKGIAYCDRIHTPKDTILEENNVTFIRDQLIALIADADKKGE